MFIRKATGYVALRLTKAALSSAHLWNSCACRQVPRPNGSRAKSSTVNPEPGTGCRAPFPPTWPLNHSAIDPVVGAPWLISITGTECSPGAARLCFLAFAASDAPFRPVTQPSAIRGRVAAPTDSGHRQRATARSCVTGGSSLAKPRATPRFQHVLAHRYPPIQYEYRPAHTATWPLYSTLARLAIRAVKRSPSMLSPQQAEPPINTSSSRLSANSPPPNPHPLHQLNRSAPCQSLEPASSHLPLAVRKRRRRTSPTHPRTRTAVFRPPASSRDSSRPASWPDWTDRWTTHHVGQHPLPPAARPPTPSDLSTAVVGDINHGQPRHDTMT